MNKVIFLRSLTLINFKGIKNLTIDFDENETSISGENATGKTTIMDAYLWGLFDKDSTGRKDFEIKTLKSDGTPVHNLDHEVSMVLSVNNETIKLRKVYREKYVKPRGQIETVFSGHETEHYYNDVPLAQRDYQTKIELICPEKVFKIITNPLYFPNLNWSEQRQSLINIAGEISDNYVARLNPAYQALLSSINGSKSLDEYKREIAMKKKRIKDDLDVIPARIDEVQRGLPEAKDWKAIETDIKVVENQIRDIDSKIADASKGLESENTKRIELQKSINQHKTIKSKIEQDLTTHIDNLKFGYDRRVRLHEQSVNDFGETLTQNYNRIKSLEGLIETLKSQRDIKIAEWHKINDEVLTFLADTVCPTCGQDLPEDFLTGKKTEAENKFNDGKSVRLAANVKQGKQIKSEMEDAEGKIAICKKTIADTDAELTKLKSQTIDVPDYEAEKETFLKEKKYSVINGMIGDLEKELEDLGPAAVADTSDLQGEKSLKHVELDSLKKSLQAHDQIATGNKRIETLKADQQRLSQELATFEKIEFTIAGFTKAKIEAVENKINRLFQIVKFKMYDIQVNGGEVETCECTVGGVPYSDLNNAMMINSGLDIISTLSKQYGISAPIFIDNAESVNKLLSIESQLIRLVVTTDKELVFN
jgi:DNA repair exonuclease SbcCD ATPase subunit